MGRSTRDEPDNPSETPPGTPPGTETELVVKDTNQSHADDTDRLSDSLIWGDYTGGSESGSDRDGTDTVVTVSVSNDPPAHDHEPDPTILARAAQVDWVPRCVICNGVLVVITVIGLSADAMMRAVY